MSDATTHEQLVDAALRVAYPGLPDPLEEPFLALLPTWAARAEASGPATVQFEAIGGYSASYNVAAAKDLVDSWLTGIERLALKPFARSRVGTSELNRVTE